jgi:uncharacterized HAD superfamily protein
MEWKKRYQELADAIKESKDIVDTKVENALYQNAMNGNYQAQQFWLRNRKPQKWREKTEQTINVEQVYEGLNKDELDGLQKSLENVYSTAK